VRVDAHSDYIVKIGSGGDLFLYLRWRSGLRLGAGLSEIQDLRRGANIRKNAAVTRIAEVAADCFLCWDNSWERSFSFDTGWDESAGIIVATRRNISLGATGGLPAL